MSLHLFYMHAHRMGLLLGHSGLALGQVRFESYLPMLGALQD